MKIKYVVIGCVVFFAGLIVTAIVIPKITTDNFVRVDLNTERYMLNEFGLYDARNYRIHQNSKGFIKIMHNQDGRWVEWKGKTHNEDDGRDGESVEQDRTGQPANRSTWRKCKGIYPME